MSRPRGMTGRQRLGVACLSIVLLALSGALLGFATPTPDGSMLPFEVPWWSLIPGYLIAFRLRLDYDYRNETRTFFLTHLPLAIGLVFVPPWWHLLARVAAVGVNSLIERHPPQKIVFNISLNAFETGVAAATLGLLVTMPHAGMFLWCGLLGGVVASEVLSIVALEFLLAILGAHQQPGTRLLSLANATVTALVFGSLSIVFVAAAWTDPIMLVVIVGVAIALIVGYRRHRILALKHQQTSELQQFVKGLGAIDLDSAEGPRVLNHVRELLRAGVLELAVQADGTWRRLTVTAQGDPVEDAPTAEAVLAGQAVLSASLESADRMVTPLMGTVDLLGVITVRERLGAQRAFGLHDLRLLETLGAELSGALERGRLQRDLSLAATTDPLTRLPNLNEVTSRLERLLESGPTGVLVATIAVESFREVNDTLGHQVGDELLLEVTRRLHLTYPHAQLGRIGGGRFAVVLEQEAFGGDLSMFGLGIRAQIEGGAQLGPVGTHIKLSVGCAQAPEHGTDASTLIRRAETAMFGARSSGGGPVVWEPVYEIEGQRRLAVVMALREAVSSGAIGVAYQPKIRLSDNAVAGVEALARWTHPALGAISPAEFIPLAEAAGLMGPLTTLVLRQALTTCKSWQRRGGRVGVSVNVSAETLLDSAFVTEVAALLTAANVSPDLLTLELTEGVVVNDPELAARRMTELRNLGLKLSVDDFGTGYSSLTYLKGLPVDEVKVDKGFVDRVVEDMGDRAVVRAVVDIAHTLGLSVVAEGVENNDQLKTLTDLGVDEAQGYLLARPMAALDMAQWLRRREGAAREEITGTTALPRVMPTQRG